MRDSLANGQRLRVFTLVDAHTRECVALDAAGHFSGRDVAQIPRGRAYSAGASSGQASCAFSVLTSCLAHRVIYRAKSCVSSGLAAVSSSYR
jgi:hypothetical protein